MGGVDKSDQYLSYHNTLRRTVRYWKTLFYHAVDIAVVNSFILYNVLAYRAGERRVSENDYRDLLVLQFIQKYGREKREPTACGRPPKSSFRVRHGSALYAEKGRCQYCKLTQKENFTQRKCPDCPFTPSRMLLGIDHPLMKSEHCGLTSKSIAVHPLRLDPLRRLHLLQLDPHGLPPHQLDPLRLCPHQLDPLGLCPLRLCPRQLDPLRRLHLLQLDPHGLPPHQLDPHRLCPCQLDPHRLCPRQLDPVSSAGLRSSQTFSLTVPSQTAAKSPSDTMSATCKSSPEGHAAQCGRGCPKGSINKRRRRGKYRSL